MRGGTLKTNGCGNNRNRNAPRAIAPKTQNSTDQTVQYKGPDGALARIDSRRDNFRRATSAFCTSELTRGRLGSVVTQSCTRRPKNVRARVKTVLLVSINSLQSPSDATSG